MHSRVTAGRLLGALTLMLPLAAQSADLDYREAPYGPRAESPYDDPRYRDLYADPEPPPPQYVQPRDDYRPYPPLARDHAYRDDDRLAPMPAPPRFSQAPYYERQPPGCLPRREIRARLADRGWSDFHDIDIRDSVAYLKAQRPSGQMFELEVDRCSGSILSARRLNVHERPYAWRDAPYGRRW